MSFQYPRSVIAKLSLGHLIEALHRSAYEARKALFGIFSFGFFSRRQVLPPHHLIRRSLLLKWPNQVSCWLCSCLLFGMSRFSGMAISSSNSAVTLDLNKNWPNDIFSSSRMSSRGCWLKLLSLWPWVYRFWVLFHREPVSSYLIVLPS